MMVVWWKSSNMRLSGIGQCRIYTVAWPHAHAFILGVSAERDTVTNNIGIQLINLGLSESHILPDQFVLSLSARTSF